MFIEDNFIFFKEPKEQEKQLKPETETNLLTDMKPCSSKDIKQLDNKPNLEEIINQENEDDQEEGEDEKEEESEEEQKPKFKKPVYVVSFLIFVLI